MATTYYNQIQQLYLAYFNRPADPAGLAFWETSVENNKAGATVGLAAIAASFATQQEYKDAYAGLSNLDIVKKVYQNLFSRVADDDGAAYWANLLTTGKIKVDNLVVDMAAAAKNQDAVTIQNKVAASVAFTAAIDTDAEKAGYSNASAAAVAKSFLSGVTDNASLAAAIAPTALNTTIAKVVAAGPFSLNTALSNLDVANAAKVSFLAAADGDGDSKTTLVEGDVATKVATAVTGVDDLVAGDYTNTSAGVKAALLADQITANNTALANAQKLVTDANAAIAKVAGLSAAIATKTAADTGVTNAQKAVTTTNADLAAKAASLDALLTTTDTDIVINVNADGTASLVSTKAGVATTTQLIKLDADNKLVLASSSITEAKYPGVGALLSSSVSKEAADAALTAALKAQAAAQANVDYLDMGTAEVADLKAIAALMTDVKVADGALPTIAQITSQQAILQATADATPSDTAAAAKLTAFKNAVAAYNTDAPTNKLSADLKAGTDAVTAANTTISNLTKATTALATANDLAAQLKGVNDNIKIAQDVFTAHDVTIPVTLTAGTTLATAASDIFVASKADATISLFNLLGTDSLYIGSQYTLNTGKLTTGNNAVLEAFVAQSGSDTTIKLEKTAFGSNAATPEVITITLTGVDATKVHLTNGIITVS
jgi:hypothetical protein